MRVRIGCGMGRVRRHTNPEESGAHLTERPQAYRGATLPFEAILRYLDLYYYAHPYSFIKVSNLFFEKKKTPSSRMRICIENAY